MIDPTVLADLLVLEESFAIAERWSRASWESELTQPSLEVLGWYDHRVLDLSNNNPPTTHLLGVIALRYGGETVDLDRIVVDTGARRRGIGRELITAGLVRAGERGAAEMILEVRTDNEAAIHLYRSTGFAELTVRRDYYGPGIDAQLMSRRLEQE